MAEKIHFISGLPRSGSTLLCNILNQNPRFLASASSAMLEVMFVIRNQWDEWVEHQAMPEGESTDRKRQVLRGILESYHAQSEAPVIFDKSRGHLAHIELLEWVLGREIKVLVPVRDLRDVLASFEKLWREAATQRQLKIERELYLQMQTVGGRCEAWSRFDQPVGLAYNRIQDALHRDRADRMLFVPYERLTAQPAAMMSKIYDFLERSREGKRSHDQTRQG